uniref:Protein TsetseEP domain-containing protein n=1 Tax=Anopheles melas TaxID=34690 RepID=A0A182TVI7_9DIPT
MYDLLRAASNLRAYLPLVQYILTTTIENIAEADSYLMNLKSILSSDVSSEASKYSVDIEKVTSEIEAQLAGDFAVEADSANTTYFNVDQLSNIEGAANHSDLMNTLSTLNNLFTTTTLAGKTDTLGLAFDKINTSLITLVGQLQNSTDVLTNPLVKELIDTLMGNDEYGRYCYNKYKDLVQGLFGQSFDSAWECVDKEYERLEYLKVTLAFIVDILAFDYEDVSSQAEICNLLTSDDNLNSCVAALAKYYNDLFAATADKVAQVFQFATDEAAASENRILICFELVNIEGSVTAVEEISDDLTTCSISGPRGLAEGIYEMNRLLLAFGLVCLLQVSTGCHRSREQLNYTSTLVP